MQESPLEAHLMQLASQLSPAKLKQVVDIASALARPIDAIVDSTSRLVTPQFADEFASRLQLHHATHTKQLQRLGIEDAFRAASIAAGRQINDPQSATTRFIDVVIDGERISLKGTAAKDMRRDYLHISKLCEAAWIQDVRGAGARADAAKRQIREFIDSVDRIYQLRMPTDDEYWRYELVEIPITLFMPILKLDKNLFAPDGPRIPVIDGRGPCMDFVLDRSDAKITITRIPIGRCIVHGTWSLPRYEASIQTEG